MEFKEAITALSFSPLHPFVFLTVLARAFSFYHFFLLPFFPSSFIYNRLTFFQFVFKRFFSLFSFEDCGCNLFEVAGFSHHIHKLNPQYPNYT